MALTRNFGNIHSRVRYSVILRLAKRAEGCPNRGRVAILAAGLKARPLLNPRYGGILPKRSFKVHQSETL